MCDHVAPGAGSSSAAIATPDVALLPRGPAPLVSERDSTYLGQLLGIAEGALHVAMLGSYAFMAGGFAAQLLR